MEEYGKHVDLLAISVDSFNTEVNEKIGRREKGKESNHIEKLFQVREWCTKYGIKFKLNTVVNQYNYQEDMNDQITKLNPSRWKVFQVLPLEGKFQSKNFSKALTLNCCFSKKGENQGPNSVRKVEPFLIGKSQFDEFVERHKDQEPVVEDNETMKTSYLLLDEQFRFLDCSENSKKPSKSILQVGVKEALKQSGYDREKFVKRGGEFFLKQKESCLKDIEDL